MINELITVAKTIYEEKFPQAQVVFLAGSVVRGEGTPSSDLDLVVVYEKLVSAYRESFKFMNRPVEAFVHDPETLRYFFYEVDRPSGVPSLPTMVKEGMEIPGPNELSDTCKIMTEKGGLGIVMEKSVRGNVTIRFKDQTVEECLNLLLSANGFDWELKKTTVVVADEMKFPSKVIFRRLVHARAADTARILSTALKKDIQIATDDAQNALVMTARQKILVQAEKVLQELDKPSSFYDVRVSLSQGKESLHEGSFQAKFGDSADYSTYVSLLYPGGADQPPATTKTGLALKLSPRRLISPEEVECEIQCDVTLLKKWNGSMPILASGKLVSTYRVIIGKPIVIDMVIEGTQTTITLALNPVK